MTALNVRIHANFYGQDDLRQGTAVVGSIYSVGERRAGLRDILIPVGVDVAPRKFELDPGSYVIEARMPSGVIVSDEVTLMEEVVDVELRADGSPYESHSWQYLAGNLEPAAEYHRPRRTIETPRSQGSRVLTRREIETGEFAPEAEEPALIATQAWWIPDSREDGWRIENLNRLARESSTADISAVAQVVSDGDIVPLFDPTESDNRSRLYRFDSSGPVALASHVYRGARQFFLVRIGAEAFLVTLPVPWIDPFTNADVRAEVMVSIGQNQSGSPIAVAMRDITIGPALAYMANGALSAAATIFENVEEMLYMKVSNQFAAAAAAYVLLGTDVSGEWRPWYSWIDNLSSWFGWLPDGAVLLGTLQLRTARTSSDVARARGTLLEAFSRGVPVYTLGLRWLIDGLSEFDDPQCLTAAKQVRELSWRVDTRQPFVVLRLNSRRPG